MDIITLTTEVKETIDLDQMSSDDLKKIVKHLWHKVQSLSYKVEIGQHTTLLPGKVTCLSSSIGDLIPT